MHVTYTACSPIIYNENIDVYRYELMFQIFFSFFFICFQLVLLFLAILYTAYKSSFNALDKKGVNNGFWKKKYIRVSAKA